MKRKPAPLAVQNVRKLAEDERNADAAREISAINTRIRESNARDREPVCRWRINA